MYNRNEVIAKNVHFLRKWKKISTIDLSDLAHLSKSTINDIERCRQTNSIEHYIEALANGLGVDRDALTEDNYEIISLIERARDAIQKADLGTSTTELCDLLVKITANRGAWERFESIKMRGDVAYFNVAYNEALTYYLQLSEIANITKDPEQLHIARKNIASAKLQLGQYEHVKSTIEVDLRETKNPEFRAKDLQLLGLMHKRQSQYTEAENCYIGAINEMKKSKKGIDHPFLAKTYQWLSDLYREVGRFQDALDYATLAVEHAHGAKDKLTEVYAKRTIALVHFNQQDFENAVTHFRIVLEIAKEMNFALSEILITEFYISFCEDNFDPMYKALIDLESFEVPPRELIQMYELAGDKAIVKRFVVTAQALYKKAIKLSYN